MAPRQYHLRHIYAEPSCAQSKVRRIREAVSSKRNVCPVISQHHTGSFRAGIPVFIL